MNLVRSLTIGLCWSGLMIAGASAQPAASRAAAPPAAPASAEQTALDALKARPWYAAFKSVLADTNTLGRDKLDPGFANAWSETEALGEAARRIETGLRDGRAVTAGAISDAVDLGASSLMARAGCFAALAQRPDFAQQAIHLAALRVGGQLSEPLRLGVKEYAQGPCESLQTAGARNFDPRRAWEGGKRALNGAFAAGTMPALARFLDERGLLKVSGGSGEEQFNQARASVDADFRRFDGLYDGHADLLKSYGSLFADYCPTDPRFCALRDMLAQWGQTEKYCDLVAGYVATYYMDPSRIGYLTGSQNDGLNRAWEAYHLKVAPACIALTKRVDLVPAIARRLDVVAPLFAVDQNALGDNGVTRVRDALRTIQTGFEAAAGAESRIKAYRAASGLDTRVAAVGGDPPIATTNAAPPLIPTPTDEELRIAGTAESERQLQLDRLLIRDIQERLLAIGSAVTLSGSMTNSTRAAIRSWQGAVGLEPTGFLTRPQIDLLRIRTQDRWVQWRTTGPAPAVDAPPNRRVVRGEPPRRRVRRPRGDGDDYIPPRGRREQSDIPGAIPAYSWR